GLQRFLGVDFDVRGAIQLAADAAPPSPQLFGQRIDGIALPRSVAALDLLLGEYSQNEKMQPQLDVVFHYRDGSELSAELPVRGSPNPFPADADPLGEAESWRGAQIAWLGDRRYGSTRITQSLPIFLTRVPNPQPDRELASLSLVARTAPFVLAITVET